ncbi:MAG TPA: methyltransferase domain-containing protein [Pirellulales bacterium]|nr:methyltransferase domain-containing protein [Pirellulales bacterium]
MDQPGIDGERYRRVMKGLARINYLTRSAALFWPSIRRLASELPGRTLTLLDVATGAGDIPVWLARRARMSGIDLRISACDISPQAIDHAREHAKRRDAAVTFFVHDAVAAGIAEPYDIVTSSLFLHHLDDDPCLEVLRSMSAATRRMLLVSDLLRSRTNYWMAYLGVRILTRSDVMYVDGPRSVEGAFAWDEVRQLCRQAGLESAELARRWPCRYVLRWRRRGLA